MSKRYDLTGMKFGKLTVIEKTINPNNKRKATFWKCICECGNETIGSTADLRSGKKIQCSECGHMATGRSKRKDIIGKTFDYLTVMSVDYGVVDNTGRQRTYCNCKCKCGNEITVLMDTLSTNAFHSCGCALKMLAESKVRDIIGEKFGRLTVIDEYTEMTPRWVKCQCDCGNIVDVIKTDVMSGHTQSCGCLRTERTVISNTKDWSNIVSDSGVKLLTRHHKNTYGAWVWNCECPFCNNTFLAIPSAVLSGKVISCGCICQSSGELYIRSILDRYNIEYACQYCFDDCRDKNKLPFDFAVFHNNMTYLIEYDGKQHYEPIDFFGGEEGFNYRSKHDNIKNEYCSMNNIPLIRIPFYYTHEEIQDEINRIIQP